MSDDPRLVIGQILARKFGDVDGQLALADMRESYDQSTFDPDPIVMAWKTGKREVYLDILAMIDYANDPKRHQLTVVGDEPEAA